MTIKDNDPASPVATEFDNLAIYCTPQRMTEATGPWFIAGIAADEKRKGKAGDFIPKTWTHYTTHFIPLGELGLFQPDYVEKYTHLALCESALKENDPWFFGNDAITHNAVILLYSDKTHEFYYIHCRECALGILKWLVIHQPDWQKASSWQGNSGRLN